MSAARPSACPPSQPSAVSQSSRSVVNAPSSAHRVIGESAQGAWRSTSSSSQPMPAHHCASAQPMVASSSSSSAPAEAHVSPASVCPPSSSQRCSGSQGVFLDPRTPRTVTAVAPGSPSATRQDQVTPSLQRSTHQRALMSRPMPPTPPGLTSPPTVPLGTRSMPVTPIFTSHNPPTALRDRLLASPPPHMSSSSSTVVATLQRARTSDGLVCASSSPTTTASTTATVSTSSAVSNPKPRPGTGERGGQSDFPRRPLTAMTGATTTSSSSAPTHSLIHDLYRSVLTERPSQPLPFIVSKLHSTPTAHRFLDLSSRRTSEVDLGEPQPAKSSTTTTTTPKQQVTSPSRSANKTPSERTSDAPVVVRSEVPSTFTDLGELSPPVSTHGPFSAQRQHPPQPQPRDADTARETPPVSPSESARGFRAKGQQLAPLTEVQSTPSTSSSSSAAAQDVVEEIVATPPASRPNCPTAAPSPRVLREVVAHPATSTETVGSAVAGATQSLASTLTSPSAPVSLDATVDSGTLARTTPLPTSNPARPPLHPVSAPRSNASSVPPSLSSRVSRSRGQTTRLPDVPSPAMSASPPTTLVIPNPLPASQLARSQRTSGCGSEVEGLSGDGMSWGSPVLPSRQPSESSLDFLSVPGTGRGVTSSRGMTTGAPTMWAMRPGFALTLNRPQGPMSTNSSRLSTPCAAASLMSTFGGPAHYPSGSPLFTLGGLAVGAGGGAGGGGGTLSHASSVAGMSHASMTVTAAVPSADSSFMSSLKASVPSVELAAFVQELHQVKEETVGQETALVTFDALCDILERAAVSAIDVQLLAALFDELLRPVLDWAAPMATPPPSKAANAPILARPPAGLFTQVGDVVTGDLGGGLSGSHSSNVLLSTMPSITNTAIMPGDVFSVDTSALGDSGYHPTTATASATTPNTISLTGLVSATEAHHGVHPRGRRGEGEGASASSNRPVSSLTTCSSTHDHDHDHNHGDESDDMSAAGEAASDRLSEDAEEPVVVFDAYVARMAYLIAGTYPNDVLFRTFRTLVQLSGGDCDELDTAYPSAAPSARLPLSQYGGGTIGSSAAASPLLPLALPRENDNVNAAMTSYGAGPAVSGHHLAHQATLRSPGSSTQSLFVLHRAISLPSSPFNAGLPETDPSAYTGAVPDLTATMASTMTLGGTSTSPAFTLAIPLSLCVVEGLQRRLGIRGLSTALISQALATLGLLPRRRQASNSTSTASTEHGVMSPPAGRNTSSSTAVGETPTWWDAPLTLHDFAALANHLAMVTETLWRAELASRQGTPRHASVSGSLNGTTSAVGGRGGGGGVGGEDNLGEGAQMTASDAEFESMTAGLYAANPGGAGGRVTRPSAADAVATAAGSGVSPSSLAESIGSNKGVVTTVTAGPPGQSSAAQRPSGSTSSIDRRTARR